MSEKKVVVPTKTVAALKSPESAAKLIASLKASKILNLDVPMSTVESLLHTSGIEEVAGYVLSMGQICTGSWKRTNLRQPSRSSSPIEPKSNRVLILSGFFSQAEKATSHPNQRKGTI